MLFGRDPKENTADLFDRKKELKKLEEAFRLNERLSIVYGVRRTGKTSLIKAALNEKEWPYAFIDVREIYLKYNSVPLGALNASIANEFAKFLEKMGLSAEEFANVGVMEQAHDITDLLKRINEWCKNRKISFILAFDETQYLRFGGSVKYDMLLAWSIDNLSNIIYVLSGSEIGTLKAFLKYDNAKAPLYGRFRNDIYLNKFSKEESSKFLAEGFSELGERKRISDQEIEDAVEKLDGVIGWLSYYGYYRSVKKLNHKDALKIVFEEGYILVKNELESLIRYSNRRYLLILKAILSGQNRWSDIKPYVVAKDGKGIKDSLLNMLLQNLVKFGVVEKDELRKTYAIEDPIIAYAVKRMR